MTEFKCLNCGRPRRVSNSEHCSVCHKSEYMKSLNKSPYAENIRHFLGLGKKKKVGNWPQVTFPEKELKDE